jgi:hypothetical protein
MTEQEELLMLRALVAKQKEELEQKDKTIVQQEYPYRKHYLGIAPCKAEAIRVID